MTWQRLRAAVAAVSTAVALTGCGDGASSEPQPATKAAPATTPSIFAGQPRKVQFAEVERGIDRLYRHRPGIASYVVRDVEYSPATRAKVLEICHHGGLELDRAALESSRIAGCAPLIFFFRSYGRDHRSPEATAVARKLYWYASTSIRGPFDARASLDALLRSWSVG